MYVAGSAVRNVQGLQAPAALIMVPRGHVCEDILVQSRNHSALDLVLSLCQEHAVEVTLWWVFLESSALAEMGSFYNHSEVCAVCLRATLHSVQEIL